MSLFWMEAAGQVHGTADEWEATGQAHGTADGRETWAGLDPCPESSAQCSKQGDSELWGLSGQ